MNRRTVLVVILAVVAVAAAVIAVVLLHRAAASHHVSAPAPLVSSSTTARPAPATPRERAFTVAERFCEPGETSDQWQRSLAPVLTGAAQTMFAATKPANVPCEHVDEASGQAIGDQQTSTDAAWQFTATTGGPVTVTLHRDSSHDEWLASYIQPES